jgi:MFS family permease
VESRLHGVQRGRHNRTPGALIDDSPPDFTLTEATPRQQRQILLPVLLVVFLAALDLTVVAPILPEVVDQFGISAVDADRYSWIVLSYLVAYTVTVPLTGRVSDFVGRIPVFSAAMALFLVGSVVVAMSDSLGPMIAGRTLQGLGGGAMLPVSMALVADVVPVSRRAYTLGLVAAVDTFGWVLGPVYGAVVNALFGTWRAIFWLNVPLGIGAALILYLTRARTATRQRSVRPSMLPAVVGTLALLAFCLALSSGGEGGVSAGEAARIGSSENPLGAYRWPLLGFSVVAFAAFVWLERRAISPVLPRDLIRQRVFQFAGVANALVGAALITAMVNGPLAIALLEDEDRVSTSTAFLLGSFTLAMTVGAVVGGRLVNHIGPRVTAMLGLLIAAAGFVIISFWPHELRLALMSSSMIVPGLGLGIVIAPIGEVVIRAARSADYGAASGLVLLARLIGMTIGLSAITAYGLEMLGRRQPGTDDLSPLPGETTGQYFDRLEDFANAQLIPLTLDIIGETFVIAAIICVVALAVVARMRQSDERNA